MVVTMLLIYHYDNYTFLLYNKTTCYKLVFIFFVVEWLVVALPNSIFSTLDLWSTIYQFPFTPFCKKREKK